MAHEVQATPGTDVRARLRARQLREDLRAIPYLLPWMTGIAVFFLYPLCATVYFSFTRYDQFNPPTFVGLRNWIYVFTQYGPFYQAMANTFWLVLLIVPASTVFGLTTAATVMSIKRGTGVLRTLFYLPFLAPPVAATLAFVFLLSPTGPINQLLGDIGIAGPSWFNDPATAKLALTLLQLWGVGNLMVIFLASLLDVPREQYEAASLDGAGPIARFWYVTLPAIRPIILFSVVTGVIQTLQYYTQAIVAGKVASGESTGPGANFVPGYPNGSTLTLPALSWTVRPVSSADRPAVDELCGQTLLLVDLTDRDGLARLLWETEGVRGFVAERGGAVLGASFATTHTKPDGTDCGALTLVTVAPVEHGIGVGRSLVTAAEASVTQSGSVEMWTGGGQPRFWWPGIDVTAPAVIRFFEGLGYEQDDDAVNMTVDLASANLAGEPPADIEVGRLAEGEWPQFHQWMVQTWEDPWSEEVTTTLGRSPVSCFVATRDGSYLGFAAYDTNRRGWFGPMGSSPAARGTGIGSYLLRLCLKDYVAQGLLECDIGWVGPFEFYERAVGAVVSRRFVRLRKELTA